MIYTFTCREAAALALLSLNTCTDMKRREISLASIPAGIGIGTICTFLEGSFSPGLLFSFIPGVFMALAGILSHGAVGMGDALVLLALGALVPYENAAATLLAALMLSGIFAAGFRILGKGKKQDYSPFVPFLLTGHLLMLLLDMKL